MQILATASSKMVCGQVLDLQAEGKQVDQAELENIHRNKTGALIQAAIMMGAVTIFAGTDQAIPKLRQFGQSIGLAFQVQDDILDITGSAEELGKPIGSDEKNDKTTYVTLFGMEQSIQEVRTLSEEAIQLTEKLSAKDVFLVQLIRWLISRQK